MALERTLSIVKPDGVARNLIGQVIGRFEKVGLKVVAARMVHLSQRDAEGFYAVHAARPFFKDLVFEDQGVKVFVDPESLPLINGTTVDFVKQGLNEAFRFHNPNIKGECGCGESFNV